MENTACRDSRINVKIFFKDKMNCWITGVAVTEDGRILMVDFNNKKVKMFENAKNVSFLPMSDELRDIAVISDSEAVVTMGCEQKLHILDIKGTMISVQETIQLNFDVMGVTVCQDTFIVTCPNTVPPSVKKVDRKGRVLWSACSDELSDPWYVCSSGDTGVALSGRESHTLTLLDGESGKVTKHCMLGEEKHPRGLCMDQTGNIYICFENVIGVMNKNISRERIIMSGETGLGSLPEAIAYNSTENKLFVSYSPLRDNCNSVDCVQLK